MRLKNWTKLSAQQLWAGWRADFVSDDDAVAHAIWCANRLCKNKGRYGKLRFYSIKNEFIRRFADEGNAVRQEVLYCYRCDGVDTSRDEEPCRRCGGSGIYKSRWLYVYNFDVAGQSYSFHSYIEPIKLGRIASTNSNESGGKFTEEEIKAMRLPWSGLLKMLGYVAAAIWEMTYDYDLGEYRSGRLIKDTLPLDEKRRMEIRMIKSEYEAGMTYQRAMEIRKIYGIK